MTKKWSLMSMNAINVELRQVLQPLKDKVSALMAEKANMEMTISSCKKYKR